MNEIIKKLSLGAAGLCFVMAGLSGCTKKSTAGENALNLSLTANLKGMDPIYANDLYSNLVISNIYETLFQYQYLKRPLELEPQLADGMPQVSKDGLVHTFKIKAGIKYQDSEAFPEGKGRELKAQDFVYAWKRLADPRNKSDGFWIFDGKIKGFNEWRDQVSQGKADYDTPVEGLKTPDDHTLVITLTKPYYQLYYVLAMPYSAPIPEEAIKKYDKEFLNHPVGTGPFMMESWTHNSQVVLVKNPNWRGEKYPTSGENGDEENGLLADAGKALPFADKVIFREITEDQPRWLNFMKGELDYIGIPKDNFDSTVQGDSLNADMQGKGIKLSISESPDVTYIAFNMEDSLLGKNLHLRRAISYAMDTKTLLDKFYNGRGIPAESPIPPGIDGYEKDFKNPYAEYSVEKAKEELKKAGFPDGKGLPVIEYSTTNTTTARQMAEYTQQNLEAIGVKIRINATSWPQFTDKIRDKKAQMWGIAWSADYPDAENFLQLLYGKNVSPGPNGANYKSKKFDDLYEKALKLPPGKERTDIYHQMRDIFVQDLPWIVNIHRKDYLLYHGWLKNFKYNPIINGTAKYLRVDLKEKAAQMEKL
jgi:ABC-type transport system substrate-binding protein